MKTEVSKPKIITGIVDIVCFIDNKKPATKTYSNFNNDFNYDTIDEFIKNLVDSGLYSKINVYCTTNFD